MNDLHMCRESAMSKFIQVKESRVIHLDLQPFLTKSQVENKFTNSWFKLSHLQELLGLVKSSLEGYLDNAETVGGDTIDSKKKSVNKEFMITGSTVRAACSFRLCPDEDIFLVYKSTSTTLEKSTSNDVAKPIKSCVRNLNVHPEKLVCFVCPRMNSSLLQLSQLVKAVPSSQHEDISKYFQ